MPAAPRPVARPPSTRRDAASFAPSAMRLVVGSSTRPVLSVSPPHVSPRRLWQGVAAQRLLDPAWLLLLCRMRVEPSDAHGEEMLYGMLLPWLVDGTLTRVTDYENGRMASVQLAGTRADK